MVPPNIQNLTQLQARYLDALESPFDYESMIVGVASPPEECPANVFDFENGIRLVIFVENVPGDRALVIRAYLCEGHPEILSTLINLPSTSSSLAYLADLVESLFRKISGNTGKLIFLGFSEGGHTPTWVQSLTGHWNTGHDPFDQKIEFFTHE